MDPTGAVVLAGVALALFLAGTAAALQAVVRPAAGAARSPTPMLVPVLTGLGLAACTGSLVWKAVGGRGWPVVGTADEALLALAGGVAFVFLFLCTDRRYRSSDAVFLPALALITAASLALRMFTSSEARVGPGALLAAHMLTIVGAGTAYTSAFVGGLLYLAHSWLLTNKRFGWSFGKLPALETLEHFNHRAAAMGFPLLTLSVLSGFAAFGGESVAEPGAAGWAKIALGTAVWLFLGVAVLLVPRFRAWLAAVMHVAGFVVLLSVLLIAKFAFT